MGAGRTLFVLGGLVVAAIAVGVWLVLSDDETAPDAGSGPAKSDSAASRSGGVESGTKASRKRTKMTGSASITGLVKFRKGAAAAQGLSVALAAPDGDPVTVQTDAAGAFRFEGVPSDTSLNLSVAAPGCATVKMPGLTFSVGDARDIGTLWLDLAAKVTVTVRSGEDAPIAGAQVEAFVHPTTDMWDWTKWMSQSAAQPVAVATATTGTDGRAVFPELSSGTWSFVASKAGFGREGKTSIAVAGGDQLDRIVIVLRTGHALSGRVKDGNGAPLPGFVVAASRVSNQNAWDVGGNALRIRTTSDSDGRFRLEGITGGDVQVMTGRPGRVPAPQVTVRVPQVKEIDLTIRTGGVLTGTVTQAKGAAPVEGAVVRASSWGAAMQFSETTTDAAGKYRIEQLPTALVNTVTVEKQGFIQKRTPGEQQYQQMNVPEGDSATKDFQLEQGGTLTGLVKRSDGGSAANMRVTVYVGSATEGMRGNRSATTDAEGRFSVDGLDKGKGVAMVSAPGWYQKGLQNQNWWDAVQNPAGKPFVTDVGPGIDAKLDLALERGLTVNGRVDGPDGPLGDVKVSMFGSDPVKSGADGKFTLEGVRAGPQVWFTAEKPGFLRGQSNAIAIPEDAPPPEVVITMLRQPIVRGRIASSTALPLKDAAVQASSRGRSGGQDWDAMQQMNPQARGGGGDWFPVKADGSFEFPLSQPEGKFVVRGRAADHAEGESAAIDIDPAKEIQEASVTLEPGHTLAGRVMIGGSGLPGARVSASRTAKSSRGGGMQSFGGFPGANTGEVVVAITDSQGVFTLDHVAAGSWQVSATADGYVRGSQPANVPEQSSVTIELQPELEIVGSVVFADGSPVVGVNVSAALQTDKPAATPGMGMPGQGGVITISDGTFRIRGLAAGTYVLGVTPQWNSKVNMRATRLEGVLAGARDAKIVAEKGLTISGRVLESDKSPRAGAWVNANPEEQKPNEQGWANTQTKEDGTYELVSLREGTYRLQVQVWDSSGTAGSKPAFRTKVPAGSRDVDFQLEEGLSISGRITDSAGKAVVGVGVSAQPIFDGQPTQEMLQSQTHGNSQPSGADGAFTIRGLNPGRYLLSAQQQTRGPGVKPAAFAGGESVPAGSTDVQLVTVPTLAITGVVIDDAGKAVAGAGVNTNLSNNQGWRNATTNTNGEFTLEGIPVGANVTLQVYARGYAQGKADKVAAGASGVRIVLATARITSGRALDAAGRAWGGVQLTASPADPSKGGSQGWAQTDENGAFTFETLTAGTYVVSANGPDPDKPNTWKSTPIGTIEAGQTGVDLRPK